MEAIAKVESHITATYMRLQRGLAIIAFLFPPTLLVGGYTLFGRQLPR